MKCFYSFESVQIESPTAVTIGMFDGMHLGHLKVIQGCLEAAHQPGLKTCVITFSNHPADHFTGKRNELLMPMHEKIAALESLGIDYAVVLPFDSFIVELPAKNFIEDQHLLFQDMYPDTPKIFITSSKMANSFNEVLASLPITFMVRLRRSLLLSSYRFIKNKMVATPIIKKDITLIKIIVPKIWLLIVNCK